MAPRTHVLHPGDVACGERGDRLETLLGSCVAIVLTDPRRTIGAMCHVVHTGNPNAGTEDSATHGVVALATMYRMLMACGITPRLCQAYVYGGGNMFPRLASGSHVGRNNARWALQALAAEGVQVLQADLGGCAYRRLAWTVGPDDPQVTAAQVDPAFTPSSPPCR